MNVASAAFDSDKPWNENESRENRRGEERRGTLAMPAMSCGAVCRCVMAAPEECVGLGLGLLLLMLMQHVGRSVGRSEE